MQVLRKCKHMQGNHKPPMQSRIPACDHGGLDSRSRWPPFRSLTFACSSLNYQHMQIIFYSARTCR
jgi:hypothetical protein